MSSNQSHPSGEEAMEDSSKSEATSTSRPSKLPLVTGFTNGTEKHSDLDGFDSMGEFSVFVFPIQNTVHHTTNFAIILSPLYWHLLVPR